MLHTNCVACARGSDSVPRVIAALPAVLPHRGTPSAQRRLRTGAAARFARQGTPAKRAARRSPLVPVRTHIIGCLVALTVRTNCRILGGMANAAAACTASSAICSGHAMRPLMTDTMTTGLVLRSVLQEQRRMTLTLLHSGSAPVALQCVTALRQDLLAETPRLVCGDIPQGCPVKHLQRCVRQLHGADCRAHPDQRPPRLLRRGPPRPATLIVTAFRLRLDPILHAGARATARLCVCWKAATTRQQKAHFT